MKKYICLFFFSVIACFIYAQNKQVRTYNDSQNIKVTQQEAYYPKGDKVLYEYIFYNIKYSEEAKTKRIQGNVMLNFTVNVDSTLTDFKILQGLGYGVDEEVIRLFKPLKYTPAVQNGMSIASDLIVTVPIAAH